MATSKHLPINATAGAVPIRNEKGEIRMEKVKVSRYVAGKRPGYAVEEDDDDDEFVFHHQENVEEEDVEMGTEDIEDIDYGDDRRLRRLKERRRQMEDEDQTERDERIRHRVHEPEIILMADDENENSEMDESLIDKDEEKEEEEIDDEEIERRRQRLRQKAQEKNEETDLLAFEEEEKSGKEDEDNEDESSEYEEESSEYEEDTSLRLKPVFIRQTDRVTIREREQMEESDIRLTDNAKYVAHQRKKESQKLAEEAIRKELQEEQGVAQSVDAVNTDDENEEDAYEAWKVRELRRIKRDREDREKADKDKDELDHLHQLTDEQREQEFKLKPKMITNKQDRGKMKFLQKYYHRGVFYLDEDDEVFKRDFAQPTLEDHFDKTILPKVMQVKKFGLAGRTKYTHLVDQDTTGLESESPWAVGGTGHTGQTGQTGYTGNKGPTVKRDFTRPSAKKRKT